MSTNRYTAEALVADWAKDVLTGQAPGICLADMIEVALNDLQKEIEQRGLRVLVPHGRSDIKALMSGERKPKPRNAEAKRRPRSMRPKP
jgi:hypothetical protein